MYDLTRNHVVDVVSIIKNSKGPSMIKENPMVNHWLTLLTDRVEQRALAKLINGGSCNSRGTPEEIRAAHLGGEP